jgi:YidC/Oxa1 family membrane protein insertase
VEDRRNIIMAVLLTGLILFGWPIIASYFFPAPPKPAVSSSKTTEGTSSDSAKISTKAAETKAVSLDSALAASGRIAIETPKLKGSVNLEGARIDDLVMLTHRVELAKNSAPVRLFAPSGTAKAHFARFGWVGSGATLPDDKTVWTPSAAKLTPETPVTLSWTNPEGQKFGITLSVDKNYMLTAEQSFTNGAATEAQVAPFGVISRKGQSADVDSFNLHVGPIGVFNGTIAELDYDELQEAPNSEVDYTSTGGWLGVTEKYCLAALVPDQKTKVKASFRTDDGYYWTQMVSDKQAKVAPGASVTQKSQLFAGAKEVEVLDGYTKKLGIPYFDYAIDWGWFWFIAIPFFWILHWLFGMFGNFGVAIIGLTIIVRGFMFPIAQKQFASMAQMRVVQPKMQKLQEKYKDDKPKLQQEMMKLYSEEKVNPLAGCLPILLQIPVFFALYKILMLSIEMRHQPFLIWLDLSAQDPWTPLNLFGMLPFTPPSFIAIGILPILVGLTMWLMQKLNPAPMDEVQKQVFAIMPWFLMFVMAPFAAGLQLYWVVSNILSIGQQKWLYSKHPILKQQAVKEAEDKAKAKA